MTRSILLALLAWAAPAFAADPDQRLALNTATAEQFAALDGVGPEVAARIVELRERRGRLGSVEELRVLPGVPEASLDVLRSRTVAEFSFPARGGRTFEDPSQVLAEFAHEPDVRQVQLWASDYAKINPATVERWLRAARSFAALPQFRVQYKYRTGYDDGFDYVSADGSPDTPNEQVVALLDDTNEDADHYITVQATWDLDQLIMSSEQIRVINEAQDVAKLREKVLGEATRLYFERRRVQVDQLISPKSDIAGQVKEQLRLAELTANLDALTGGAFSAALAQAAPK